MNFTYVAHPTRVVFGAGRIRELAAEVERLGARRVLLICTPGRAAMVRRLSSDLPVSGLFSEAAMHTPAALVEKARQQAKAVQADACVALGGGSTIGFGKAIALSASLPVVAVPTTYSGSEMTTIWGVSEGGEKRTGRDPRVLPRAVIYDPELTLDLPPAVSAASGMNAIAHCAEALYAHDGNPIVSLMAEEGIRALASALPEVIFNPRDGNARSKALYGAWLAGMTISTTSVALHHKLCHILGGFGLPHAETHAIVLPHALAYNAPAAPAAMQRISRALNSNDAPEAMLFNLLKGLNLPTRLADIGMKEADLERAARMAVEAPYPNPRKVEYAPVLALLRDAYEGRRPA
jgi:maleylacetate reductase